MAIFTLPESDSVTDEGRNITSGILLSLLFAELVLIFSFAMTQGFIAGGMGLSSLLASFFFGTMLARLGIMKRQQVVTRLCYGFLLAACGLVLLIIAFQNPHNACLLLPGVGLSGLGQGWVAEPLKRHWKEIRPSGLRVSVMVLAMIFSSVIILLARHWGGFTGATGLLTDLALLGGLYCKIIQQTGISR
ncbi:hypothetical protein [Pantoea allii]|uniref:hypothetical protein n=1 Tax=Pantoea allii TaxID=574096 RepID=UPI0024B7445F|nr:hypothetical protein [Pantoea allii]MDJ0091247.1 hypothetical protein [Pantoea allii]